jgi:hypothetical protein
MIAPNVPEGWVLEEVDPARLIPNKRNREIYGEPQLDDAFVESVVNHQRNPIKCTQDYGIIAGHRRRDAAIKGKKPRVTILRATRELDPLEVEQELILDNFEPTRRKTREIEARELLHLARINKALADRRQQESRAKPGQQVGSALGVGILPTPSEAAENPQTGRALDIAAKAGGVSRHTADKMIAVVQKIDQLVADGDVLGAKSLRDTFESKPVAEAFRLATQPPEQVQAPDGPTDLDGCPIPKALTQVFRDSRSAFGDLIKALCSANAALDVLLESPAKAHLPAGLAKRIDDLLDDTRDAQPKAVCPVCREKTASKSCRRCAGLGWISAKQYAEKPVFKQQAIIA